MGLNVHRRRLEGLNWNNIAARISILQKRQKGVIRYEEMDEHLFCTRNVGTSFSWVCGDNE
jgi:hypothetical protein